MVNTYKISCGVLLACLSQVIYAEPYRSPKVSSQYVYATSTSGHLVSEVVAVDSDRYSTKVTRERGNNTEETRLLGIQSMAKHLNEGVLPRDAQKAAEFFPLQVGKKVAFDTYGQTTGPRWYRSHTWEAVQHYSQQIGPDLHQIYAVRILSESPGFFKFEGTCHYSTTFATCLKLEGQLFVRGNSNLTGPVMSNMIKARVGGVEMVVPTLTPNAISSTPAPVAQPVIAVPSTAKAPAAQGSAIADPQPQSSSAAAAKAVSPQTPSTTASQPLSA